MNPVKLTPADIGWTAGIIDGEGCIGVYKSKNKRTYDWKLVVTVDNTDIRMVQRLHTLWGGRLNPKKCSPVPNRRPVWGWKIHGQAACEFLREIRGSLVCKGEQADVALDFGKTMVPEGRGQKLSETTFNRRVSLSTELKRLKKPQLGEN